MSIEGLVAARPGVGTFVTKSLADDSLAAHAARARTFERWLAKARRAGLDDESIEALIRDDLPRNNEGGGMTVVLESRALSKRYGRRQALTDCTFEHPRWPR